MKRFALTALAAILAMVATPAAAAKLKSGYVISADTREVLMNQQFKQECPELSSIIRWEDTILRPLTKLEMKNGFVTITDDTGANKFVARHSYPISAEKFLNSAYGYSDRIWVVSYVLPKSMSMNLVINKLALSEVNGCEIILQPFIIPISQK